MRHLSITPRITVTIGHPTRSVLRLRHHRTLRTRRASNVDPTRVELVRHRRSRRRSRRVRRTARASAGTTRPRRCDGTRLATRMDPRTSPPVPARGSGARQPHHAAAVAVVTTTGAKRQPGGRMTRHISSASTARIRELFRRSHYEPRRQNHAERQRPPARHTRGCRAAFHRRRPSRPASTPSTVSVAAMRCCGQSPTPMPRHASATWCWRPTPITKSDPRLRRSDTSHCPGRCHGGGVRERRC